MRIKLLLVAIVSTVFLIAGCVPDDPVIPTCGEIDLRPIPADPSAAGPWTAGSKTVIINGLVTEVWYPAVPGSQEGKSKDWIDTRAYMPESDPDPTDPGFQIDSYADLPLDSSYGPYPVIIYVHGTGSFRQASHKLFTHWAGRGFVVLCADNPGIMLGDLMSGGCEALLSADQAGDTRKILAAVRSQSGDLGFLKGALATDRIGLSGHSAGGMAINGLGSEDGVKVIIPMASGGVAEGESVVSTMVMGGKKDGTATESVVRRGYNSTPIKKRLVLIPDAGHNVFLSVCNIIEESSVSLGALSAIAADGCGPEYMAPEESTQIVRFAATAAFEEVLTCSDTAADQVGAIAAKYPGVEYEYDPNGTTSSNGCN